MKDIFSVFRPQTALPLIFDSPHSGAQYPAGFNYVCDLKTLRTSEDKFVDDLFENAPDHGAALLAAHFPRAYIDVNRAVDDIDPQVLSDEWPHGPLNPTPRSEAGIGLIWRLAKPGMPIYGGALTADEILSRIARYYDPYHAALKSLIEDAHYKFGQVWHINCHSMPAAGAYPRRPVGLDGNKPQSVDFVLGDRDATSCDPDFTRSVRAFLQDLGYRVTLNDPFKGVEILRRHGNPARGRHALQLEINRALYMDEETGEKSGNYKALKTDIERLIHFCAGYVEANLQSRAAD